DVLTKLHHANQMEIEAGKLAQTKGESKAVKTFGKTLVSDHTAADKQVVALAKQLKVDLPKDTEMKDDMLAKVKATSGSEFDMTLTAGALLIPVDPAALLATADALVDSQSFQLAAAIYQRIVTEFPASPAARDAGRSLKIIKTARLDMTPAVEATAAAAPAPP